jgi:hypothetical protein
MSEILLRWLNDEVRLQTPVSDFEADFANGFSFGELLDKHQMQPDFHLFIDGDHPDAKTNNFVLLEPTLRTLGVRFDSRAANAIMFGQPGAAQKLLYQVMVAVRGFVRNVLGNDPAVGWAAQPPPGVAPATLHPPPPHPHPHTACGDSCERVWCRPKLLQSVATR